MFLKPGGYSHSSQHNHHMCTHCVENCSKFSSVLSPKRKLFLYYKCNQLHTSCSAFVAHFFRINLCWIVKIETWGWFAPPDCSLEVLQQQTAFSASCQCLSVARIWDLPKSNVYRSAKPLLLSRRNCYTVNQTMISIMIKQQPLDVSLPRNLAENTSKICGCSTIDI